MVTKRQLFKRLNHDHKAINNIRPWVSILLFKAAFIAVIRASLPMITAEFKIRLII